MFCHVAGLCHVGSCCTYQCASFGPWPTDAHRQGSGLEAVRRSLARLWQQVDRRKHRHPTWIDAMTRPGRWKRLFRRFAERNWLPLGPITGDMPAASGAATLSGHGRYGRLCIVCSPMLRGERTTRRCPHFRKARAGSRNPGSCKIANHLFASGVESRKASDQQWSQTPAWQAAGPTRNFGSDTWVDACYGNSAEVLDCLKVVAVGLGGGGSAGACSLRFR